jgi:hypothetical protein
MLIGAGKLASCPAVGMVLVMDAYGGNGIGVESQLSTDGIFVRVLRFSKMADN